MRDRTQSVRRSFSIPKDLYDKLVLYARKNYLDTTSIVIMAIKEFLDRRSAPLMPENLNISNKSNTVNTTGASERHLSIKEVKTDAHEMQKGISQVQEDTNQVYTKEAPEVTQEVKEEPMNEEVKTETSEPAKPELPKGEVPLAGLPSSEKPKEPSVDFSWATRRGNLKELVMRWVDVFRKWDIKQLEDTFKRCKGDDPTREAVIIVMKERFVKTLPETEKAAIRKFFKDEEVQNFMKEHGIEGIKEPTPEEEPEGSQEVKADVQESTKKD